MPEPSCIDAKFVGNTRHKRMEVYTMRINRHGILEIKDQYEDSDDMELVD
jgi:hypothetical protein